MLRKQQLYTKAITLRLQGFSYNEILQHIPVAQSTISRWCRAVPLTVQQRERLIELRDNNPLIQFRKKEALRIKRRAKEWAKEQRKRLLKIDESLLLSGILLYWAEGTKLGVSRDIEFTNTDFVMIVTMLAFFKRILGIPKERVRVMVRISDKGDLGEAESYWAKVTGISKHKFRRPELLKLNSKSKSLEKYPCGMCRLIIHDIFALRKLSALIELYRTELQRKLIRG